MNKKEKALKAKKFAERLANNKLSDYEYAMWIANFRESDAETFLKVYGESDKTVPFRLWVNGMIAS
jgi:hypothetical protein